MEGEEDQESRTGGIRGREEAPVSLVCAALFHPLLTFDSLCLLLGYVSLLPGGFAIRWEGQLEALGGGQRGGQESREAVSTVLEPAGDINIK